MASCPLRRERAQGVMASTSPRIPPETLTTPTVAPNSSVNANTRSLSGCVSVLQSCVSSRSTSAVAGWPWLITNAPIANPASSDTSTRRVAIASTTATTGGAKLSQP